MDLSQLPGVRVVWALWRAGEARLRAPATLPPVIAQFADDEIIPLKGVHFRVAHRGPHGIVLAPVSFTAGLRKRLMARLRGASRVAQ